MSSCLCLLCPSGQHPDPDPTAPTDSPRWTKPAAEPYLSHLGPPAWSGVPGLSVFIASICAVLWARWPATSAPRLGATIPGRPSPDPARTPVGPSMHSRSCPLCHPSPRWSGPGWNTGTRPCFSFSDQEINSPQRSQCLLLVSQWKRAGLALLPAGAWCGPQGPGLLTQSVGSPVCASMTRGLPCAWCRPQT